MKRVGTGLRGAASAALLLSLSVFGCQSLIDLEERRVAPAPWCEDYCDVVMSSCSGGLDVYSSRAACLAVCDVLDPGSPDDLPKANTVRCRRNLIFGSGEAPVDCSLSGPVGGDQCGSDCEGYCQILVAACSDTFTQPVDDCVRECAALRHGTDRFTTNGTFVKGDTFQCRAVYASNALLDPSLCKNAVIAPVNPQALCTESATEPPKCEDYCRIAMVACTGDNALYESNEQCLAACNALPAGTNADSNGMIRVNTPLNTIGCRKFHVYGALAHPEVHCHHGSATGDGYCGDEDEAICESYCMIAKQACGAQYSARFLDDEACEAECQLLPGVTEEGAEDEGLEDTLVTARKGGQQVPCLTLHALRVLEKKANPTAMAAAAVTECPIALGMVACPAEP
ncbi:MAG TPA: hypothetical protein VG937_13990 [Polyangiaceae bacterium]|nr:hypothetical protein [Polyangiaceae bacterium]